MDRVPLLGSTKAQIMGLLRQESRTAVRVASALGIQVSAARKHLERLREMGIVRERFEAHGPGRPKKIYSLTEEGQELFPRRYDAVLNALLARLVERRGEAPTGALMAEVAADLGRSMSPDSRKGAAATPHLLSGLNELGFDVRASEHAGTCTITSRNCPILAVAKRHRELVCRGLHAELLRAATGGSDVLRGKWIVDGDSVCTHTFRTT